MDLGQAVERSASGLPAVWIQMIGLGAPLAHVGEKCGLASLNTLYGRWWKDD